MTDQQKNEPSNLPEKKKRQQKPKGRGHGEGSVFKRKTGDRNKPWVAQITLTTGKKRVVGYFETEKEAIAAKNQALARQERGKLATGPRQTVGQYLEYWIENIQKLSVKLTTYRMGKDVLRLYILPALGHVQLTKLTRQDVQSLYGKLQDKKLSASRINFVHVTLHKALRDAVDAGLLSDNVSHGAKLPRIMRSEKQVLTPKEAQMLLEAAKGHWLEALFTMAITTGMRRGELLGLKWKDINLEQGYLQVRRSMQRVSGQGATEFEPKTRQSKRRIELPSFLLETLKQQRISQLELRLKRGNKWQDNDFVFPNTLGHMLHPYTLVTAFDKLLAKAGLPHMRFHDLRHSAATILLTMGVSPNVVQEILGHSDIRITLGIYGHVLPGIQGQAMERMGEALQKPGPSAEFTRLLEKEERQGS